MPPKKLTNPPELIEVREGYYQIKLGPATLTFIRRGDSGICEVYVQPVGLEDE